MRRKTLLRLAVLFLGVGVLVAVLHLSPVRQRALGLALRQIEAASGLEARAERLDYDLLNLDFRVQGLQLGVPGREPVVRAREGRIRLAARSLLGSSDIREVQATGLVLNLVRDASGMWNLPASRPGSGTGGPRMRLRSLDVRQAEVLVVDGAAARVHARDLSLQLREEGGTTRGTLRADAPVEWSSAGREGQLELAPVPLVFDGRDLALDLLRVRGREGSIEVKGRLRDVAGQGTLDLELRGDIDLAALPPTGVEPLRGTVTVSGRLEGPLATPTAQLSWSGRDVTAGPMEALTFSARTRVDPKAVVIESATAQVAGGTVTLDGRAALDAKGKSRLVAKWRGLGAHWLGAQGMAGTLAGRAEGEWLGPRPRGIVLVAELRADPSPSPPADALPVSGRSELRVRDGAWTMAIDYLGGADLRLTGTARGSVVESDLMASTLAGDLRLEAENLPRTLFRDAMGFGGVRVEATLDGTLGAPHAAGSLRAESVEAPSVTGVQADLVGRFEADRSRVRLSDMEVVAGGARLVAAVGLRTSDRAIDGRFTFFSPDVAALSLRLPAGVDPSGSLRAEGTLGGTLPRPDHRIEVSGADLRLAGQTFASMEGTARLDDRTVRLESLVLKQAGGRLALAGDYTPRGTTTLRADARGLALLPLPGPLAGRPDPLPVSGVFDLELAVAGRADAPEGKGWIAAEQATWQGREVGPLRAELALAEGKVTTEVSAPALHASLVGRVDFAAPYAFELEAGLDRADLGTLAEKAGLALEGLTGTANGRVRFRGELAPRRIHAIESAEGLVIESGTSRLSATGALAAKGGEPLRVVLDADLADASRWLPGPATGRVTASLEAAGQPSRPRVEGEVSLEGGTVALSSRRRDTVRDVVVGVSLREGVLTLDRLEATWAGARVYSAGTASARFFAPWLPAAVLDALDAPPSRAVLRAGFEGDPRRWLTPLLGDDTFESRGRESSITAELEATAPQLQAIRGEVLFSGIDPVLSDVALTQEGTGRARDRSDGRVRVADAKWTGPDTEIIAQAAMEVLAGGRLARCEDRRRAQRKRGPARAPVHGALGGNGGLRHLPASGRGTPGVRAPPRARSRSRTGTCATVRSGSPSIRSRASCVSTRTSSRRRTSGAA